MKSTLTALLATISPTLISSAALADGANESFYGYHEMMWGNWFMGPMMMLVMLAIGIVVIVVILKAFGLGGNANSHANSVAHDNALRILSERFAKGEIDKTEYEERKSTLSA